MGAAVPLIAADRSVQCCSVIPGDCDVNCACVCFCLCVTALQLTRALTSFALKYCSSEQNHGHTNTKTQSRRWQFQCCSRLACVLLSIYECVYVCVCVLTTRYVGAYVPVQICPVVVWELCAYVSSPVSTPQ